MQRLALLVGLVLAALLPASADTLFADAPLTDFDTVFLAGFENSDCVALTDVACDGADTDACLEGAYQCPASQLMCTDETTSTPDVCNGLDDDCDPSTEDGSGNGNIGTPCVIEGNPGIVTCMGEQGLVCVGATPPTVVSVDNPVIARGAMLGVTGTHYDDAKGVTLGGVAQQFLVDSANHITVTVGGDTPLGTQDLVVTNPSGSSDPFSVQVIAAE